jgi:hypothetical protein
LAHVHSRDKGGKQASESEGSLCTRNNGGGDDASSEGRDRQQRDSRSRVIWTCTTRKTFPLWYIHIGKEGERSILLRSDGKRAYTSDLQDWIHALPALQHCRFLCKTSSTHTHNNHNNNNNNNNCDNHKHNHNKPQQRLCLASALFSRPSSFISSHSSSGSRKVHRLRSDIGAPHWTDGEHWGSGGASSRTCCRRDFCVQSCLFLSCLVLS